MGGPLVLSGRPEDVRDIFRADPMIFEPWNTDVLKPVLGSNSVILTSGTKHREYRKLLVPPVSWPTNALIRTKYGFSSSRLRK